MNNKKIINDLKEAKNKIDFLYTHNKNYNNSQYYCIVDLNDIITNIIEKLEEKENETDEKI